MTLAQLVTHLAVITPFLLLASCRGLHVMEGDDWPQATLILGAHHKTGTELLKAATKCFDSSFKYALDPHWKGGLRPHERALHLTRNPYSLALSAYLYHKLTGEDWTLKPGRGMEVIAKDTFLRDFLSNHTESYTDFLRRVPTHVGLRAELMHLSHELDQIEVAEKFCGASKRCMEMCLEDFTASSSSYDASWRKALGFVGEHVSPEMQRCLSKEDLNRHPVRPQHSGHVTANSYPEWRFNQLRKMVMDLDAMFFNSRLKKMGEGRRGCGASQFVHSEMGSQATDGGEYAGWLMEEQYS